MTAYATDYSEGEIRDLVHRGFDIYREGSTKEEAAQNLLNDIDYFFQQAMDADVRNNRIEDPPVSRPSVLAVLSMMTANAVQKHPQLNNAPLSKIQLVEYLRTYHINMLLGNIRQASSETKAEIANQLYREEMDHKRPRPATGISGLKHRPDEHETFEWFFEIPLVAAGELCEARMHDGQWGGGYDPNSNTALGEPNYHIDNNCVYVPMSHTFWYLAQCQEDIFEHLATVGSEYVKDSQIQWALNNSEVIKPTINDISEHGDMEELWTGWDPQKNLLRLVRNAARNDPDLDSSKYNKARDYYDAIQNYDAEKFGENSAKNSLKSVRSLGVKLTNISKSDEFPSVDHQVYDDRRHSEYSVGSGSGNYREVTLDTLEDIFELPCFQNMVDDLKLENSGPVRKQLYNFVRMVYWLQGYHELPEQQREDEVVEDIHELFENKWDWYDRETTDYQARYELRNGEINGNVPVPMGCDNKDMEHHCIGRRACPYSIYQSLPFPQDLYDYLDELSEDGRPKHLS